MADVRCRSCSTAARRGCGGRGDVDRVYAQAAGAGAISMAEPADKFYGDRVARISDPCGNQWDIASHGEDVDMDEMLRRMPSMGHQ